MNEMSEELQRYSMKQLFKLQTLEAYGACKKAGGMAEYFTLLQIYCGTIAEIVESLVYPQEDTDAEREAFNIKYGEFEELLLSVGAADAALNACITGKRLAAGQPTHAALAHLESIKRKALELFNSIVECEYLPAPWIPAEKREEPEAASPKMHSRKMAVSHDTFNKLCMLIENAERDAALLMCRSMMDYTFTKRIDLQLASICYGIEFLPMAECVKLANELVEIAKRQSVEEDLKKVLAVDDMPDVLSTVTLLLRRRYDVFGVTTPLAAVKYLLNNHVDIMIMDIGMPDIDGFSLLRLIRKIKGFADIPALFLTGNYSVANVVESVNSGGADFIRKPVNGALLIERIEKQLKLSFRGKNK